MAWTDEQIGTERLTLRPAVEADKAALAESLASARVRRYLGGPVAQEHIDRFLASTVGERWGSFVIADAESDECVGGLHFSRGRGDLEVSYELLPDYWGQGFAGEAVGAAADWAWANTDATSIIAITQTANTRSCALLARLGFSLEREFEEFDAAQSFYRLATVAAPITCGDGAEQQ